MTPFECLMSRLLILVIKVDMQEFVKLCLLDKVLGDAVLKIFRAVISKSSTKSCSRICFFPGTWSFIFERWSSGMFFVQTKPPKGIFWDKMSDTSFQTASFHSPAPVIFSR